MATCVWLGSARDVAQVDTATIGGTLEVGDLFTITIGQKTFTYTAATTTVATEAAAMVTAFNALSATLYPEFSRITAAYTSGGSFTLTADDAGVPFTATYATTEAGGGAADAQTFSGSTTTTCTGKNYWDNVSNWSGGAVPVNSDDVYIEDSSVDILYGLAQSAVTLTSLNIAQSFTGSIGNPRTNTLGYYEYRATYLAIGATTINIGRGVGSGSGRLKINTGTAQTTVNVTNSGTPTDQNVKSIVWKGTHASNVVNITKGSFAAAQFAGETATIATLRVGYSSNRAGDSDVWCGTGVTLTTVNISGGTVTLASNSTTLTITDGTLTILAGTVTTLNVDGGKVYQMGTGTITTANIGDGGELNFSRDMRGRTVTNCTLNSGGSLQDPFATGTFTNGVILSRTALADVKLDVGTNKTLTVS